MYYIDLPQGEEKSYLFPPFPKYQRECLRLPEKYKAFRVYNLIQQFNLIIHLPELVSVTNYENETHSSLDAKTFILFKCSHHFYGINSNL